MQGKKKTTDQFMLEAIICHGDKYDYSSTKYIDIKTKVDIICSKHGIFSQWPSNHLAGHGCPTCYQVKNRLALEDFVSRAMAIHDHKYDYSYINVLTPHVKVKIHCPLHDIIFEMLPSVHLFGQGCKSCGYDKNTLAMTKTLASFVEDAYNAHDHKYDYSKVIYINSRSKIEIICPKHGSFYQIPNSHINDKNGCPSCAYRVSYSESKWLDELGIPNDPEHRQVRFVVNGKVVIADGFMAATKTFYEFYGDKWHGNPAIHDPQSICDIRKISFGEIYQKTVERESKIKQAGYNVVSIWENDWRNK